MEKPKLKIMWSSVTPTLESGYGRVTREVVSRLIKRGYDVINHGYQTMGKLHTVDGTFKMLDAGGNEYGMNVLSNYFKRYNRDILITLFDIWAFFGKGVEKLEVPWIPYFPVDAEPVTVPMSDPLKYAYKRVCFSKFAEEELKKVNLDSHIIYHGVNTKIFKPFSEKEKKKIRKKIGIPEDAFLIGTNGTNAWDRKDFPRMIRIFAEFVKECDAKNALLYLHASPDGVQGHSYSLVELGKLYGIEKQLRYSDGKALHDTGLAKMYNTFDVYLSTSRAEGCGLPILEAQACGVPAIVPDNSAQPEWVEGHGWVVPCSDHIVVLTTPQHNKWYLMDVDFGVQALKEAYQNKELLKRYGEQAREAMLQYDWDKIVDEQWIPFLKSIEKEYKTGILKLWACGNMYNIRKNKIDLPVIFEVVHNKTYSRYLNLTKDDVWIDIGGHIGTFSIDIASKVKQVIAFEPSKENQKIFKMNLVENKIENVLLCDYAVVGNDDKERTFFIDTTGNTGGNSLIAAEKSIKTKVPCVNINKILCYGKKNKIKMDCEGAEYEIIKAMDFDKIDEMVFEYHFNLLSMTKYEELLELLKDHFEVKVQPIINPRGQCIVYCKKLGKVETENK